MSRPELPGVVLALHERTAAQITGLDITEAMLRRGRQRLKAAGVVDQINLVVAQAERLPFADDTFETRRCLRICCAMCPIRKQHCAARRAARQARRADREPGVLGPGPTLLAILVGGLHAVGSSDRRLRDGWPRLVSRRGSFSDRAFLRTIARRHRVDASCVAASGVGGCRRPFDESGWRTRDVGASRKQENETAPLRSMPLGRADGAIGGRCSIRPTPPGIFRMS